MTVLEASGVSVAINGRRILDKVSVTAAPGRISGLVGPNGAGKTTLVRVLAGLQEIDDGEVLCDGVPAADLPRREFARRVAYLAQAAEVHWPLSVGRLVALGRLPRLDAFQTLSAEDQAATELAMTETDVLDLADRPVTKLSGGERARVMLARAFAGEPEVLLADEPVAALDPYHQLQVMELLACFAREGTAIVVVLHDLTLAARFCDHLVLIDDGRHVASGPPGEVLSAENLRAIYRIEAELGERGGEGFVVPWSRVGVDDGGG